MCLIKKKIVLHPELIIEEAVSEAVKATQAANTRNTQTTKDDIVHLIHLFKEPSVQKHWCNLCRVLSRAELDSRKAAEVYNKAANPLTSEEKRLARDALLAYAFPNNQGSTASSTAKVDLTTNVNSDDSDDESAGDDDQSSDSILEHFM
jgi:hypothetical protein